MRLELRSELRGVAVAGVEATTLGIPLQCQKAFDGIWQCGHKQRGVILSVGTDGLN